MGVYEKDGIMYHKLILANDVTNGGMCVVCKMVGTDARSFVVSLDQWNKEFIKLES